MRIQEARAILDHRLQPPSTNWLTVETQLRHFALITYALPAERLARHIPSERFDIFTTEINGTSQALISVVPFVDVDFHFMRIAPFAKFHFAQTNYRAYVIDKASGELCVWFFGTTLGSPVVHLPRVLWRIPWHPAHYDIDCAYDANTQRYQRYRMQAKSSWSALHVELHDSGNTARTHIGFADEATFKLVLTHPITGYFYRLDGALGSYRVWHDELTLSEGNATTAYFGVCERLGLLSRDEMLHPISVLMTKQTTFKVLLPPHRVA